jgi:homospermidine synthase
MIVNLSVDTSSVDLMDLCKDSTRFYIDTVVEPWPGLYTDPSARSRNARTTRCAKLCSICAADAAAASPR